jgi:replicative DNA helicase Mcm
LVTSIFYVGELLKVVDVPEVIVKCKEFIETYYLDQLHALIIKGERSLSVTFSDLIKFDPDLAEDFLNDPEEIVKTMEIALQQFTIAEKKAINIRIYDFPRSSTVKIRNIRSDHINKFVVLEGLVRQSSDVRPQVVSAKFECPACSNTITMPQLEQKFKEPTRCSCGRRGQFRLLSKELVDAQRLIIEESPESLSGGEQPKRLSIFLRDDLVEPKMEKKTTPGSKIKVGGIIKEVPIQSPGGGQLTRFDLIGETNSIEPIEATYEDIEITKEDEGEIKRLAKDPKIYQRLINSIAPSIFGHEDIKGALVLQLMGGIRKERGDGTVTKGDIHILLVGDPGAAKSSMLMYMAKAAPKARYVAGRSATSAGITATVVKDEFLRGWALEAGAIVLANGGFLLLDEMDKMSVEDTSALHEAMAQQTVTIAKANIQATLSAKTAVLAAANPKLGRFDPYQPIASQIDLPPALINRFDLIFPVRDLPNKDKDTKIASHVLETQQHADQIKPEIPVDLLKKYIAYVRQHVFPKLTTGAVEEIKEFYVTLRNSGSTGDEGGVKPIPISARQLEALVRLAEGSARVRLSQKVTRGDAKKAISILRYCLMQVGLDYETGQIDIDRISTGIPASTRNKIVIIREIINAIETGGKKVIPLEDIISDAADKNITEAQVEEIIEKLKREGEVYEPRRGWISKI